MCVFASGGIGGSHSAFRCVGAQNLDTLFFMLRSDQYGFNKNHNGTCSAKLVFLHPVLSAGHIVHSGASGAQNIVTLFIMLRWDRFRFNKKNVGTRYAELVFLHRVGSMGHVVHSSASGA
jgi:hypothetical protein